MKRMDSYAIIYTVLYCQGTELQLLCGSSNLGSWAVKKIPIVNKGVYKVKMLTCFCKDAHVFAHKI